MPNFVLDTEVGEQSRERTPTLVSHHSTSFFIEGHRGGQRGGRLHHGEAGQGRHAREVDGQEDRLPNPHVQRLCHLQRGMILLSFYTFQFVKRCF